MKPDFNKGGGLLPTVVQDNTTKSSAHGGVDERRKLSQTLETKETWFWSTLAPRTMA